MDREEIDHIMGILRAFAEYEPRAIDEIRYAEYKREQQAERISIPGFEGKLQTMENCVHMNQMFLHRVAGIAYWLFPELQGEIFGNDRTSNAVMDEHAKKVAVTLAQTVRDWSEEGIELYVCANYNFTIFLKAFSPSNQFTYWFWFRFL